MSKFIRGKNKMVVLVLVMALMIGVSVGGFNHVFAEEPVVEEGVENQESIVDDGGEDLTVEPTEPVEEEPVENDGEEEPTIEDSTEELPTEEKGEEESPIEQPPVEGGEEPVETVVVVGSNIDELVFIISTEGNEGLESKEHTMIIEEIIGQVVIEAKESVEDREGNIYNFVEWQGIEETGRILTFGNDSVVDVTNIVAIYELEVVEEELSQVDVVKEKYNTVEVVEVAGGIVIAKVSGENVDGGLTKLTARDFRNYKDDIANFEVNLDTPVGIFNSIKAEVNKVIFNTDTLTEEWYVVK